MTTIYNLDELLSHLYSPVNLKPPAVAGGLIYKIISLSRLQLDSQLQLHDKYY